MASPTAVQSPAEFLSSVEILAPLKREELDRLAETI